MSSRASSQRLVRLEAEKDKIIATAATLEYHEKRFRSDNFDGPVGGGMTGRRELVAAVLVIRGAEVVSFGSAIEALDEMKRQPFNVLVSDIGMPEMDGYWLINKVRQLPAERGGRIPAVALTAYAGIEDRKRVLLAGYQMHIPKPVEAADLTSVVASLAERNAESRH